MTLKILIAVIVITAVIIALLAIFLPNHRSTTETVRFNQGCRAVWEVYADPESQPQWRDHIQSVKMETSAHPISWTEKPKHGPSITFTETNRVPGELLELTLGAENQFEGRYRAVFAPTATGCIGTFTEEATFKNPVAKLLSYAFFNPKKSIQTYAREAAAEAGRRGIN